MGVRSFVVDVMIVVLFEVWEYMEFVFVVWVFDWVLIVGFYIILFFNVLE